MKTVKTVTVFLVVTLTMCSLGTLADGGRGRKEHTEATASPDKNPSRLSEGRKEQTEALVWPKRKLRLLKEQIGALKTTCQAQNWISPDKDPLDNMPACTRLFKTQKPCSTLECKGYAIAHLSAFRKPFKIIRKNLRGSLVKTINQTDHALRKLLNETKEACMREAVNQGQNESVCKKRAKRKDRKSCRRQIMTQTKNGTRSEWGQLLASLTERLETWFRGKWEAFGDLPTRQIKKLRNSRIKQMKRIVKKWGNTHENKEVMNSMTKSSRDRLDKQEEKCGPLFDTGFACRCTSYLDCKRSFSQGMTNFKEPLLVLNASEIFDRVKNGDRPSAASFAVEDMVFNISGRCKEEARKAGENATVCEPSQEHAGKICAQFLREKLQTGNSDSRREIVYRFLNDFDMFVKKFDATSKKRRKVSEESKRVGKKRKNIVKNLKRECRK